MSFLDVIVDPGTIIKDVAEDTLGQYWPVIVGVIAVVVVTAVLILLWKKKK